MSPYFWQLIFDSLSQCHIEWRPWSIQYRDVSILRCDVDLVSILRSVSCWYSSFFFFFIFWFCLAGYTRVVALWRKSTQKTRSDIAEGKVVSDFVDRSSGCTWGRATSTAEEISSRRWRASPARRGTASSWPGGRSPARRGRTSSGRGRTPSRRGRTSARQGRASPTVSPTLACPARCPLCSTPARDSDDYADDEECW